MIEYPITVRRGPANELLIEWRDEHGQIVGTFHPAYIGVALAEAIESRDAEIERLRLASTLVVNTIDELACLVEIKHLPGLRDSLMQASRILEAARAAKKV